METGPKGTSWCEPDNRWDKEGGLGVARVGSKTTRKELCQEAIKRWNFHKGGRDLKKCQIL